MLIKKTGHRLGKPSYRPHAGSVAPEIVRGSTSLPFETVQLSKPSSESVPSATRSSWAALGLLVTGLLGAISSGTPSVAVAASQNVTTASLVEATKVLDAIAHLDLASQALRSARESAEKAQSGVRAAAHAAEDVVEVLDRELLPGRDPGASTEIWTLSNRGLEESRIAGSHHQQASRGVGRVDELLSEADATLRGLFLDIHKNPEKWGGEIAAREFGEVIAQARNRETWNLLTTAQDLLDASVDDHGEGRDALYDTQWANTTAATRLEGRNRRFLRLLARKAEAEFESAEVGLQSAGELLEMTQLNVEKDTMSLYQETVTRFKDLGVTLPLPGPAPDSNLVKEHSRFSR